MTDEVSTWRQQSLMEANALITQRETEQIVARNALALHEQMQCEAHREHQRALDLKRMEHEFTLAKVTTVDAEAEAKREFELVKLRHDCELARTEGLLKGMAIGSVATLGIGMLVTCGAWMFFL